MIEINSGIITNIILKAREINIADDLTMPEDKNDLSTTEWEERLTEYQKDETFSELYSMLADLEPDQQSQVIALMYVGRGDYSKAEWHMAISQANTIPSNSRASYLMSKTLLSDYLEEGLEALGISSEE